MMAEYHDAIAARLEDGTDQTPLFYRGFFWGALVSAAFWASLGLAVGWW
jgi:hypothetical protein